MDFSELFHNASKKRKGETDQDLIPPAQWPKSWKTIVYKTYPRFKKISLFKDEPLDRGLFELIRTRQSGRRFSGTPLDLRQMSTLLRYSCGLTSSEPRATRRAQPSAGSRYPIEVYPVVFLGTEALPAGVYHYNVVDHALEMLWQREFNAEEIAELFFDSAAPQASVAFIMTAVLARNQEKYGPRGYRHILIEAGHIGQNVYLASGSLGLKSTASYGFYDQSLEDLVDIDGYAESVVYTLLIG